jgi:hypothetical protein
VGGCFLFIVIIVAFVIFAVNSRLCFARMESVSIYRLHGDDLCLTKLRTGFSFLYI